jgi:hypothetical protein
MATKSATKKVSAKTTAKRGTAKKTGTGPQRAQSPQRKAWHRTAARTKPSKKSDRQESPRKSQKNCCNSI